MHLLVLLIVRKGSLRSSRSCTFQRLGSRACLYLEIPQEVSLSEETRLSLLRSITETVQYAHEEHLAHRALCPQSILVRTQEIDGKPSASVRIFNWQTARRDSASSTSSAPLSYGTKG